MKNTITSNLKQAFFSPAALLSVLGTVIVLTMGTFEVILDGIRSLPRGLLAYGWHQPLLQTACTSDVLLLALPILCTLPYTASYLDELRSGFIKESLPRSGFRPYIMGKLLSCVLSGGLCLVVGAALFRLLALILFSPLEMALPEGTTPDPWLIPMLECFILLFVDGGFWSLVGMTMAAITGSKYMAYASPFIFYYVLVILYERYFKRLYIFNPKEWMNPLDWTGGIWGVVILLAELTLFFGILFYITAERRLRQL